MVHGEDYPEKNFESNEPYLDENGSIIVSRVLSVSQVEKGSIVAIFEDVEQHKVVAVESSNERLRGFLVSENFMRAVLERGHAGRGY